MECAEAATSPVKPACRSLLRAGQLIYFDTNIFDPKTGLSDSQLSSIKNICGGILRVVFGIDCLEEALLGLDSAEPERALEHVRRVLNWTDPRLIAKPSNELLSDDLVRFSHGQGETLSPWLENPRRLVKVKNNLRDLRNLDIGQLKKEFAPQIVELRERRDHYVRSFKQTIRELSSDPFILDNRGTNFPDFYRLTCLHVVKTWVQSTQRHLNDSGLMDRCREQGLEKLLDILSVRLATTVTLSLLHAQLLNEGLQTADPRPSDHADLRHAAVASSAEVFVTNDRKQFKRLSSIPNGNWRVIWFKDFIESLRQTNPPS